jgi:hypothetical protein
MAVKIALLKTGQFVIADIQEMIVEKQLAGYYFYKPCLISIVDPQNPNQGQGPPRKGPEPTQLSSNKTSFNVSLYPWIPLAKGTKVPVVTDWVVTFTDPVDMLFEMYENDVLKATKDWNEGMNRSSKNDENLDSECKTCR